MNSEATRNEKSHRGVEVESGHDGQSTSMKADG
jgi:hypothetical protein